MSNLRPGEQMRRRESWAVEGQGAAGEGGQGAVEEAGGQGG